MISQGGLTLPLRLLNGSCPFNKDRSELLLDSIGNIIETSLFQPTFTYQLGCRLNELLGEPNSHIVPSLAKMFIQEAITELDNRLSITRIATVTEGSSLIINIYMIDRLTGKELQYNTTI